jgi:hypothetical protein
LKAGRQRRDTAYISNGAFKVGSVENPIPCDVKVEIRINGDKTTESFGPLPGIDLQIKN